MIPTPIERQAGRFMRAPDHDAGGDGGNAGDGGSGDAGSADKGGAGSASAADGGDETLLGGATDTGASDKGEDGDAPVQDGSGDQSGDGDDEAAKLKATTEAADAAVPEAYKLDPITIGEGDAAQTIEIDSKLLEDVTPLLKEAGVTQGAAKKLAPAVLQVQQQVIDRVVSDHKAQVADWEKAAKADPEIGGDKLPETLSLAAKALDKFGAPSVKDKDGKETNEFRALLNQSGFGSHPVFLKMFRQVGQLVGEDGELIRPDTSPAGKKDRLEALYPNDVPNKS